MLKDFKSSPLWLIGLFITFSEGIAGFAAVQIEGCPQEALVWFVILYSAIVTVIFFLFLFFRPQNLYPPSEYKDISPDNYRAGLAGIPTQTADAVKHVEQNPSDENALFALLDSLIDEVQKQHLILLRKKNLGLDITKKNDFGFLHNYTIVTRNKGLSMGMFSHDSFLYKLRGTDLVILSDTKKEILLTERGERFADWLITNKKDAETFESDIGRWGKKLDLERVIEFRKKQMSKKKPKPKQ